RATWSSTARSRASWRGLPSRSATNPKHQRRPKRRRKTNMATTLNPSEISDLIKSRIEQVKLDAEARNEGTVTAVADGIVRIYGLADVMQGEMIELPYNTFALALNLER